MSALTSAGVRDEIESRQLLDLFVQDIRKRLEGEVIKALKPVIDRAVDDAVAELNPVISKHYDVMRNGMVHHLLVSRRGESK